MSARYSRRAHFEKRHFDRVNFARVAAVDFGDGLARKHCEILDISEGGARLRPVMCAPEAMPDQFTLLLSPCGKVRRICRVAWRSAGELGVQFAGGREFP